MGQNLAGLVQVCFACVMFCVLLLQVHLWTLSVGHTVSFSVLFAKTWRIYSLVGVKQKVNHRTAA